MEIICGHQRSTPWYCEVLLRAQRAGIWLAWLALQNTQAEVWVRGFPEAPALTLSPPHFLCR